MERDEAWKQNWKVATLSMMKMERDKERIAVMAEFTKTNKHHIVPSKLSVYLCLLLNSAVYSFYPKNHLSFRSFLLIPQHEVSFHFIATKPKGIYLNHLTLNPPNIHFLIWFYLFYLYMDIWCHVINRVNFEFKCFVIIKFEFIINIHGKVDNEDVLSRILMIEFRW